MKRSLEEHAQTQRLENIYERLQSPVMLSIQRRVCGCDYGANSWTTRVEAEQIGALLGLRSGMRFVDVGSGSGWPGLYMAVKSGCDVVLVDLPLAGLRVAADRAGTDQVAGNCWVMCADAAYMPFRKASFDALSHSDLLCCLKQKRTVLESCQRVTRMGGRMVFTVISIAPNLSQIDQRRAVGKGPEFVEAETDYLTLLAQTGWTVLESKDLSLAYAASVRRQAKADKENKDGVIAVIGACEYADRQTGWVSTLSALDEGLLRRELFVTTPTRT